MKQASSSRLHYAWIIAGVTFFILLIGAGIRSAPGVFMVPVEQEFGWSRSSISIALSINLLLYGLVGPFAAAVMDRCGIRRITIIALILLALGPPSRLSCKPPGNGLYFGESLLDWVQDARLPYWER